MNVRNIAAYTECDIPPAGEVVAFVSVNEVSDGVQITSRSRTGQVITLDMPWQAFRRFARDQFLFAVQLEH